MMTSSEPAMDGARNFSIASPAVADRMCLSTVTRRLDIEKLRALASDLAQTCYFMLAKLVGVALVDAVRATGLVSNSGYPVPSDVKRRLVSYPTVSTRTFHV